MPSADFRRVSMRAEIRDLVDELQQSLALLRRHL